ncbi:MAG: NAD(P)-dependent oxidoreductase [Lentisphaeraceae bacterium]|nr:NAD(P)-dependent oxidoreductase [Lentisphaeraceae bacterium]
MNTYLIIGASGCIGFETAKWILTKHPEHKVITCSRGNTKFPGKLSGAIHECGDIASTDSIYKIIEKHKVSHILHCAALRTTECNDNPERAHEINVQGTMNVAKAAELSNSVKEFIFISTAAVYDQVESQTANVTEEFPVKKYAPYVATKLESEELLKEFSKTSKIKISIIRPQILFGPTRSLQGSTAGMTNCIRSAALKEKFQIPFSGQYSFHYTGDVGPLIGTILITEKDYSYEIFNLPGNPYKVSDFCDISNSFDSTNSYISFEEKQYPFALSVSYEKYLSYFGEVNISDLSQAITETYVHFKN